MGEGDGGVPGDGDAVRAAVGGGGGEDFQRHELQIPAAFGELALEVAYFVGSVTQCDGEHELSGEDGEDSHQCRHRVAHFGHVAGSTGD